MSSLADQGLFFAIGSGKHDFAAALTRMIEDIGREVSDRDADQSRTRWACSLNRGVWNITAKVMLG